VPEARLAGKLGPEMEQDSARFYGIYVAEQEVGASLSPSYMREIASGGLVGMMKFLREILVVLVIAAATVTAFGQRGQDKRPPKEPGKVVTQEKEKPPPPPQNSNRPNNDGKKKP